MDCDFNTIIKKLEDLHINYLDKDENKKAPDLQKCQKSETENPLSEEKCEVKLLKSKMFLMQEANKDRWLKMNKDLNELKCIVKKKDKTIAELNEVERIVKEKDEAVLELEGIVKEKNETIVEFEGIVNEKDEVIVELEGIVKEKVETIVEFEGIVNEKDEVIVELEGIVKEKDEAIVKLEDIVKEKNETVVEFEGILKEKDEAIVGLEVIVKKKEETIAELEGVVTENNEAIVELEGIVKEKNETIVELEGISKEKEEAIAELNKAIHELKMKAKTQEKDDSKMRKQEMDLIKDYYEEKNKKLKKEKDSKIKHLEKELSDAVNSESNALDELERNRDYNRSYKDKNLTLMKEVEALENKLKQKDLDYRKLKDDFKRRANTKDRLFQSSWEFSSSEELNREYESVHKIGGNVYTHVRDMSSENKEMFSSVKNHITYHEEQIRAQTRRKNEWRLLSSDSSDSIEEEEDDRKLFVGGLPLATTKKNISRHFSTYGDIDHIVHKTDAYGLTRGFAFVVYESSQSLSAALQAKEHKILHCRVKVAKAYEKNAKIFVANLDPSLTDHEIQDHFEVFGPIVDFKHPFDPAKNQPKRYCFITFMYEIDAIDLISLGSTSINGYDVVIESVKKKPLTGRADVGLNQSGANTRHDVNDWRVPSTGYAGFQCNGYCEIGGCDNYCIGYGTLASSSFYV